MVSKMVEQLRFVTVVPDIGSKALGKALVKNKSPRELSGEGELQGGEIPGQTSSASEVAAPLRRARRPDLRLHAWRALARSCGVRVAVRYQSATIGREEP